MLSIWMGSSLSDPSLTINNIAKSDEGIYVCRATNRFGTISSEDSVLNAKVSSCNIKNSALTSNTYMSC